MPSATLNNSDPGSAIGQAGKSHSPASFKIKGQGGIKEKDNTSLKQRLHSAVPISQVPTTFCCRESAGARVLQWCQGTAPQCTPQCTPQCPQPAQTLAHSATCPGDTTPPAQPQENANSAAGTDQPWLPKHFFSWGQDPIRAFRWVQITTELQQILSPICTLPKLQPRFSRASWQGWTHGFPGKSCKASWGDIRASPCLGPAEPEAGGYQITLTTSRPLSWVCLKERCYISWGLKDPVLLKFH